MSVSSEEKGPLDKGAFKSDICAYKRYMTATGRLNAMSQESVSPSGDLAPSKILQTQFSPPVLLFPFVLETINGGIHSGYRMIQSEEALN
jgi:hypothetical protein